MINENDRDALVAYRMQQAIETIELAKFLAESQKLVIAVNRIYYDFKTEPKVITMHL